MFYYSPYLILPLFSSLVTGALALYLFGRRREPSVPAFLLMLSLLSVWACAYAIQTAATELWLKVFLYKVGTTCVYVIAPTALAIAAEVSGFGHWLTRRRLLIIGLLPVPTLLSAWTMEYHSLNRYDLSIVQSGPLLVMGFKVGPLFLLHYLYISVLFSISMVLWLSCVVRGPSGYRLRSLLLFIGTIVPFGVDHLNLTPYKGFSLTTSTLWFTGACYTLAIFRFRLLEVLPAARSALFENLGEPVLVLDSLGRVADSNRAARELLMPGLKAEGAALLEAARKRFPITGAISASPSSPLREVVVDGIEKGRYWQVSTTPLDRRGYFLGVLVNFHDITELKCAENAMRAAGEAAEEGIRAKSQFLATVSHELRTPLQAIIGFSDLAQELDVSGKTTEYLDMINDASVSLLYMVNDILDFSRIEEGRMEFALARFDIHSQLRNIAAIHSHLARQKGIAFSMEIEESMPEQVVGDPLRVRQVLTNIIGNAVKFTEKGEVSIVVSARPSAEDDGGDVVVRFSVRDTGIGIAEGNKAKVFERFAQADPGITRRYGGSGLGAAIARRLAAKMGGDVIFESHEGEGSRFDIVIPFTTTVRDEPAAPASGHYVKSRPLSILLAEDNLFNKRLLVDTLTLRGHDVALAGDGREAVELWRAGRFDLILMDLMMPVMDGYEAARRIRAIEKEERLARTPIFALTAKTGGPVRERCIEAGMLDYIAKPVTSSRLDKLLARFGASAPPRPDDLLPPGHVELFDSSLLGAVVNDPERAARYAELLRSDLDREMGRLSDALASGDRDAVSRAAHSIKGATRPIKGSELSALAEKMHDSAESGSEEVLNELLAELRRESDIIYLKIKNGRTPS